MQYPFEMDIQTVMEPNRIRLTLLLQVIKQ